MQSRTGRTLHTAIPYRCLTGLFPPRDACVRFWRHRRRLTELSRNHVGVACRTLRATAVAERLRSIDSATTHLTYP